jgi:hypothetical protein
MLQDHRSLPPLPVLGLHFGGKLAAVRAWQPAASLQPAQH